MGSIDRSVSLTDMPAECVAVNKPENASECVLVNRADEAPCPSMDGL